MPTALQGFRENNRERRSLPAFACFLGVWQGPETMAINIESDSEEARRAVSKDGRWHDLACGRPSRRAHARSSGRGSSMEVVNGENEDRRDSQEDVKAIKTDRPRRQCRREAKPPRCSPISQAVPQGSRGLAPRIG